jgi:hypothetical protein
MSAKDSEKQQWPDPKDYGLPFVEITPIRPKAEEPVVEKGLSKAEKKSESRPEPVLPAVEQPVSSSIQTEKQEEKKPETKSKVAPTPAPLPQKKSNSWAWAAILIGLGIVSVLVWQILSQSNSESSDSLAQKTEITPVEPPASAVEKAPESTPSDQNQAVVNQDSITPINNSNPNISKPAQTGTTIANTAVGNLIRITSKAERPQYFIIVGSLPNEKLAEEEASQYFGKAAEVYLISPYDGGSNFRLAIAKFGSFRLASEELDRIKSNYSEELWILKY